jgi:hypothetical protein
MTPKEKAEDMVNTFRMVLMNEDTDCGEEILCTTIAIKHAQICVAEVLQESQMIPSGFEYEGYESSYKYFKEVQNHLNNM